MKKILISLVFLFLVTTNVKAMNVTPTGQNRGSVGSTIEVNITLNRSSSEKEISAIDGTLSYDSDVLTLKSQSSLLSGWTELSPISNGNMFSYANLSFSNLINTTSSNIVKAVFEIKKNTGTTKIEITNPSATDEVGNLVTISGGSLTINIVSDVNTLSSLKIEGTSVNNFNSNTTTYSKTVSATTTSVNIEASKTDEKSTITGDVGTKTLNYGLNTFKITVTSESGVAKTYTLNITREDNRSKINTLKTLSLSVGTINFNSNTKTYNVIVKEEVEKVTITSTLTDSKSKYVSGYGNREVTLNKGLNQVLIKVQAENGSINTYTLNITRGEVITEKGLIKDITIENHEISFQNDVYDYEIKIDNEDKLNIKVVLEDENGTYEILDNEKLENGSIITIKALSSDKSITREYRLNIRKDNNTEIDDTNINEKDDNVDNSQEKNIKEYIPYIIFGAGFVLFIISFIYYKKKRKIQNI